MNPFKKLLAQAISATVLAVHPAYRITQLQDILGVGMLDGVPSFLLTVLFILAAVNAFNLIDGINCLASGLAFSGLTFLAFGFHQLQQPALLGLCAILCGGILAFILHNRTPARIFLGDAGSMVLGFLLAACTIRLLESRSISSTYSNNDFHARVPLLAIATFFLPFLDMTRVLVLRLMQKRSPFAADRSHIHHHLLDAGMSHMQASSLLVCFSVFAQITAIATPGLGLLPFLMLLISVSGIGLWILNWNRGMAKIQRKASLPEFSRNERINPASGSPYPQFIKHFIAGRDLHKKYKPKKMQEVPEMEISVK
jgi:UDP-N-acetylmuramyl pentapeptide phosphotransferase/UDP-N-acetylglucosamine-1-phosphate transferase